MKETIRKIIENYILVKYPWIEKYKVHYELVDGVYYFSILFANIPEMEDEIDEKHKVINNTHSAFKMLGFPILGKKENYVLHNVIFLEPKYV